MNTNTAEIVYRAGFAIGDISRHHVRVVVELRRHDCHSGQRTIDLTPVETPYLELAISGSEHIGRREGGSFGKIVDLVRKCGGGHADVNRLCDIWDRWHLNGLNAGTQEQRPVANGHGYDATCNALKAAGLLVDRGYTYGSAWLLERLPEEIVAEVKALCQRLSEGVGL